MDELIYPIPLEHDAVIKDLQMPSKRLLRMENELVSNHEYMDVRWMYWSEVEEFYAVEKDLLQMEREKGFAAVEEFVNDECFLTFEYGVNAIVAAVAAIGAVPITSCGGHEVRSIDELLEKNAYPSLAFFSDKKLARELYAVVRDYKEIGYSNACMAEGMGLTLYAQKRSDLIEFSRILQDRFS